MTKVASVAGLHTRYDVPTKCSIVGMVLNNTYESKKALDSHISGLASFLEVNPVTIKTWVSKYQKSYEVGQKLPKGVMSFSFTVLEDDAVAQVNSHLKTLRETIVTIRTSKETSAVHGYQASELRTKNTPKEILNELIVKNKQ